MLTDYCPLNEFSPGEKFQAIVVAVRTVRGCLDKNGRPYADLKIADYSGSRSAKIWKVTEPEINALSKADFLEITGQVDASEQFAGQFTINRYAIAPTPDDLTPFLEHPPKSNKEYRERFATVIKNIRDPELRAVLRQMFGDEAFRRRFFRAYAASGVHHAFPGGLLEHTVEVAELCAGACEVLKGLDRDLLVCGALLHDIGKMEEMNQELHAGEYTDDGCLIGHIVLGTTMVTQAITRINERAESEIKIAPATERALLHLILSHHGLPEHGAARKPAFAEAAVLFLADNISAKSRQFMDLANSNTMGATSVANRFLDAQVYVKPLREPAASSESGEEIADFADVDYPANTEFVTAVTLPIHCLESAGCPDDRSDSKICERRRVIPPPGGADFLLRVTGDSMIDADIRDGDLLFVRKQDIGSDGDLVVAHIGGAGQTIKRLRRNASAETAIEEPYLESVSATEVCSPILLGPDCRIQGKVTGLLRDL